MRRHHALWLARAARRVDQAGQVILIAGARQRFRRVVFLDAGKAEHGARGGHLLARRAYEDGDPERRRLAKELPQQRGLAGHANDGAGPAIVQHIDELIPLGGAIDDHEDSARLERCKDAHHQLDTVGQEEGHPVAGSHTVVTQRPRHAVSHRI